MKRTTTIPLLASLLLLALSLPLLPGCGKEESKITVEDFHRPGTQKSDDGDEETKKEPMKVSLPTPPPASGFVVPEKNADGTLRVRGIIHNQDKYIDNDQEITLKGIISYISPECDPKKAKAEGRTCLKANLSIKDDVDSPKSLQVVGYSFDFVKKAKLEPGQEHLFTGKYLRKSNGFINSGDGLFELIAVDDKDVDPRRKR